MMAYIVLDSTLQLHGLHLNPAQNNIFTFNLEIMSEYDYDIPQSQTAHNRVTS